MLSFQITDENGKAMLVKRVRRYGKNYPDWTIVPVGNHMVVEVSFSPKVWNLSPLPEKDTSRKLRMNAIFEIPEDKHTREHNVWTGKVSSPEHSYTIYR